MGRSHYAPAVKNRILRGRGLIRLGRGVPMVTAIATDSLSQEMAAGEGRVDLGENAQTWQIMEGGEI